LRTLGHSRTIFFIRYIVTPALVEHFKFFSEKIGEKWPLFHTLFFTEKVSEKECEK
jgi:hypothetical protein